MIAHTAFAKNGNKDNVDCTLLSSTPLFRSLTLPVSGIDETVDLERNTVELVMAAKLHVDQKAFVEGAESLAGQPCNFSFYHQESDVGDYEDFGLFEIEMHENGTSRIVLKDFPPGSCLLFKRSPPRESTIAVKALRHNLGCDSKNIWLETFLFRNMPALKRALEGTTLIDLNILLYRCSTEEEDLCRKL